MVQATSHLAENSISGQHWGSLFVVVELYVSMSFLKSEVPYPLTDLFQWEGLVASVAQSLLAGSSVSLLWGWVATSIGTMFVGCSLAEMAR